MVSVEMRLVLGMAGLLLASCMGVEASAASADPTCSYLNRFIARELPVRSELPFKDRISLVTLADPVEIGDNGGQREVVFPSDFPGNPGWLLRPALRTNPRRGPYKKLILNTNPVSGERIVLVEEINLRATPTYRYFPLGVIDGTGVTEYSDIYNVQHRDRVNLDDLLLQPGNQLHDCN